MFKKTTLLNGLRILTVPQDDTQTVTVLVLVGTGSKYEKKEENGISHFLEHMFFKGTKERPTPLDIAETLDKVGGEYNAFTGEEYTGYYAKVEASQLETALSWVSDIFMNSLLPAQEMEKEKGVIAEEINMIVDNPMSYVQVLWPKLLYGDQPAGWSISGTKESVRKIGREALSLYREKQYVASNTIVVVAGKINEEKVIDLVKKHFADIKSELPLGKLQVIEEQKVPNVLIHSRKTDQTHFCLGVRTYNLFHPSKYPLQILGKVLGGMMSSRLFTEVREKLGAAYYIRTETYSDTDTGYLVTESGVDNSKVEQAISTVLNEYKKIATRKVGDRELQKSKSYIKGKMALSLESSDEKAFFFGGQELLEKKILTPEEIYREIDKVTGDDILKVGKDIFENQKLNLALIGPYDDKEKLQKLLNL